MPKPTNRRFRVAIVALICASGTFAWFKTGLSPEQVLDLATAYYKVILGICGTFIGLQSLTDYKKKGDKDV